MDQIEIKSTLFVQYSSSRVPGANMAIIPLDVTVKFDAKSRAGYQMPLGWTQEIKVAAVDVKVTLQDCISVPADKKLGWNPEHADQHDGFLIDEEHME